MLDKTTDLAAILDDPSLLETAGLSWAAQWIAGDGGTFDVTNPARGDVIAEMSDLSRAQVAEAIDAGRARRRRTGPRGPARSARRSCASGST